MNGEGTGWSENSTTDLFESCSHCGVPFRSDVRYPVTVRKDDEGDLQIHSFCDSDCQEAWVVEN